MRGLRHNNIKPQHIMIDNDIIVLKDLDMTTKLIDNVDNIGSNGYKHPNLIYDIK